MQNDPSKIDRTRAARAVYDARNKIAEDWKKTFGVEVTPEIKAMLTRMLAGQATEADWVLWSEMIVKR